jgi:hypothetical protein
MSIDVTHAAFLQTDKWIDMQSGTGVSGLLDVMAHEARHSEGYPHRCGTNDQTLQEMGAWGVEYYLDRWEGLHSTPSTFLQDPANPTYYHDNELGSADYLRTTRFCTVPPPGS